MADLSGFLDTAFAGSGETPEMNPNVTPVRTVSHEEFQERLKKLKEIGYL